MAALNFKKRFAGKILNRQKRQTIRAVRKYPIVPGETLYLYTGLRTKYCEKLREVKCKSVELIHIHINSGIIILPEQTFNTTKELNSFAKADGFTDWEDMKAFWLQEHGVKKGNRKVILRKFIGILIKWL
jgi:predicted transcriptional regulator